RRPPRSSPVPYPTLFRSMVATNDGHYVRREDAHAHDVLLAIQTKEMVASQDRMRFPCDEFYVKTPEEMAAAVPESEYPGAIANRSEEHTSELQSRENLVC